MRRLLRRCGLAGGIALLLLVPDNANAATRVHAASILRELSAGHPVVLTDVTVVDGLELPLGTTIRAVFKCRQCTFMGPVSAEDATFDRTIDLTGSTFARGALFRGATFQGPALFRGSLGESANADGQPLVFGRRADFSLAVFEDIASFAGAKFVGAGDFGDVRFLDVTFASTEFNRAVSFDRASFRGIAIFNSADFAGPAGFGEADFRGRTDFSVTFFHRGATFTGSQFANGSSFLAAEFDAPGQQEAAAFDSVTSSGNIDFTFTVFKSPHAASEQIAIFDDLVCSRSLVFRQTEFPENDTLSMTRLQVADLVLAVGVVKQVETAEDQRDILHAIETSARTRDDLGVANSAHYEVRVLRSAHYHGLTYAADYVLYRGVAGYFVKPFRPLLILAAIATLVALWRFVRQRGKPEVKEQRRRWRVHWRGAQRQCADLLTCLLDTFALAGPRWRSGREGPIGLGERIQAIVYRLLLVCALVGLANSNPTLRNMVDTLV